MLICRTSKQSLNLGFLTADVIGIEAQNCKRNGIVNLKKMWVVIDLWKREIDCINEKLIVISVVWPQKTNTYL